ncbi:MAG TPA: PD-(D/E)XK nuclease family protein, partial [Promineifilum sp.]|nr:PD-(D/E)XK nuclease family protein [Promineifilum sp.]
MDQKFRLSPSTIASYFKPRCDRQFRWNSVEQRARGRTGIGWNIPPTPRFHSRPGITLLMDAGNEFEVERLALLRDEFGADQVFHLGVEVKDERQVVRPLPMNELAAVLRRPSPPRFAAQILIDLEATPEHAARFLEQFDLNPNRLVVGTARPDLVEIITDGPTSRLRVWDFKASQSARHEHFIQVAFYTFLLEEALRACGLEEACTVDTETGVIYSREGRDEFLLAPYRMAIEDFLRHRMMGLLSIEALEAHYHVNEGCPMCQYFDNCRTEADVSRDLSRVAYMTSESKRRLVRGGIRSHRDLALLSEDEPRWERLRTMGHDLSINLGRYAAVSRALEDGHPRPLEARSLTIPAWESVRVILSAEQDPVTNTCFALGIKTLEGFDERNRPMGKEHIFLLENPLTVPNAEARMLLAFLRVL